MWHGPLANKLWECYSKSGRLIESTRRHEKELHASCCALPVMAAAEASHYKVNVCPDAVYLHFHLMHIMCKV